MEVNSNNANPQIQNESNPLASNFHVRLSMPESFDIEIVEASHLSDYELWAAVSSLMLNLLVGFVVAAATNTVKESTILLWSVSGIFFLLFVGSVYFTIKFRKRISKKKQTIKMVATPEQIV